MIGALQYTKDLEASGFTKDQANMLLKFQMEVMESKFATKQDIQLSALGLRSDMKEMELRLRSDMKEMESGIRSDMKEQFNFLNHKIESTADKLTIRLTRNMVVLAGFMSGTLVMVQKFL